MKRISVFLIICCLVSFTSLASLADGAGLKVYVDNQDIGVTALERNGVSYVPVTALALALKTSILWNPATEEIVVNGKPFSSVAFMQSGVLYVPVEAVARGLGIPVEWDGRNGAIRLESRPGAADTAGPMVSDTAPEEPPAVPVPDSSQSSDASNEGFYVPRTSANADFSVTVTNVESSHLVKDYYKPGEGKRFVVVHVSEQNISDQIQMYTGKFTLEDSEGNSYDYLDGLSNFYLQILRPGGINFGTLIFEVPENAAPGSLILQTYGNSPLRIPLQ